ncbi:MAG: hypothetical protein IJ080_08855 [Oscillospiraceae bacterium]|nr:hypothetical protein [Oscillospiraceae bacterium]MBQ8979843.1 hypothetical protein [Oscillospiraceae bacterium]
MDIENYLSELFAFSKFDDDSGLRDITSSVLAKYGLSEDEDELLFDDELENINAAMGNIDEMPDGFDEENDSP